MVERYGVMLVERDEVIMHVYERDALGRLLLLSSQRYPLPAGDTEVISVITEFLQIGGSFKIAEWKLCSRVTYGEMVRKVFDATGIRMEMIQEQREQELVLLGMAAELV